MSQKLRVISNGKVPGGWSCFLPEIPKPSKRVWTSPIYVNIVKWVSAAMITHNLKGDAEQRIHQHTAARLLREGHKDIVSGVVERPRTLHEHWRGTKAFFQVKAMEATGRPILVSQEEAEQRASICASGAPEGLPCEKNLMTGEGTIVEQAQEKAMSNMVDGRTTEFDDLMGKCGACSCRLATIVHLAPAVVLHGMTENDMAKHPAYCWKHNLKK